MSAHEHLLIVGGSRGIGAAIVRAAVRDGYAVTFTYRNDEAAARALTEELAGKGDRAQPLQFDAGNPADAEPLFAEAERTFGRVDRLVNNAGITGPLGEFVATDDETLRKLFEVNVLGPMAMCRAAVKRWLDDGVQGVIVNIGSTAAATGAPHEYVGYAASKAALETFSKGLGKELGPAGIRVLAVSPGTTDTSIHAAAGDPERPARVAQRVPLRRVAAPAEVADVVLWALSNRAGYVTGTVVSVAGGL